MMAAGTGSNSGFVLKPAAASFLFENCCFNVKLGADFDSVKCYVNCLVTFDSGKVNYIKIHSVSRHIRITAWVCLALNR